MGMIGNIGECLVEDAYGLELMTASNKEVMTLFQAKSADRYASKNDVMDPH